MKFIIQHSMFTLGLLIFSYGIALAVTVQHLGIHPWDVLSIALFDLFGLSIGTWAVIVGMVLVGISLILDKKYINYGTFLNGILVGPLVDLFLWLDWFPASSTYAVQVIILLFAIVVMGFGGGMYAAAKIGVGPRDGFMLSISDKVGWSISRVRIIVESSVLVLAFVLGGPVFIFTFIYTFIQSPIFQQSYHFHTRQLDRLLDVGGHKFT
ncbi:YczE/YyaS/YitT family protein [Halalkalibacillus halophilus]|uniref:YczE/YyaS/YitT family protein n=1 Tax=Halalkalibacillus halophilus TaxID=392827 RepID=UPI0004197BFF|nr:YitT family protein [Halalkalibacillus halophilus]